MHTEEKIMKNEILTALNNYGNVEILNDGWGDWLNDNEYVLMFKVNKHNVYRVILFTDCVIFQCVDYAFYVNGNEFYDNAIDYKSVHTTQSYEWFKLNHPAVVDDDMIIDNDMNKWADYVVKWVDECEIDNPEFTEYENK